MATIKLGAFITNIAGSIGGTNFRRHRASTVVSNKTAGGSKNKLKQNKALTEISKIVRSWSALSLSVRNQWNVQATNYQFPDKFGDMKNLTGRQLYIKLASGAIFANFPTPNVNTLSSSVQDFQPTAITFFNDAEVVIQTDTTMSGQAVMASFEFLKNDSIAPTFKRRKIVAVAELDDESQIGLTIEDTEFASMLKNGDKYRVYLQPVNLSGFKGNKVYIDGVVSGIV